MGRVKGRVMGFFKRIWNKLPGVRPPDFIIGRSDHEYMRRWWVWPRNRWFNLYLHQFVDNDDDRALHDHPWASLSIVLRGSVREWLDDWAPSTDNPGEGYRKCRVLGPGRVVYRSAKFRHRLDLFPMGQPCWTLFFTGPQVRVWGFVCPQGWRPWQTFVDERDHGAVGRGCE